MKVGFDVSQLGPRKAGCGFYAQALIEQLLQRDQSHSYRLLTSFGDFYHNPLMSLARPQWWHWPDYGPRFLRLRSASQFWNAKELVSAALADCDLIHANNFWCPPWPLPQPLIYTLYDLSFAEHPEWHLERNRLGCFTGVLRASIYATEIVAISRASRLTFLRHFPHVEPDRIRVIHPASRFSANSRAFSKRRPRHPFFLTGRPFLLCTGTIEPRKNQQFLLKVYSLLRARGQVQLPLVFAGGRGWLMADFEQSIRESNWADDVISLGYVDDSELAWLYSHCSINLYPSLYEGFGLPVLEGMGFGAPVVCSNTTSMPEIVADAGVVLNPVDQMAWVDTLEGLLSEPNQLQTLHRRGLERAHQFNWQRSTDQLLEVYLEACEAKSRFIRK